MDHTILVWAIILMAGIYAGLQALLIILSWMRVGFAVQHVAVDPHYEEPWCRNRNIRIGGTATLALLGLGAVILLLVFGTSLAGYITVPSALTLTVLMRVFLGVHQRFATRFEVEVGMSVSEAADGVAGIVGA